MRKILYPGFVDVNILYVRLHHNFYNYKFCILGDWICKEISTISLHLNLWFYRNQKLQDIQGIDVNNIGCSQVLHRGSHRNALLAVLTRRRAHSTSFTFHSRSLVVHSTETFDVQEHPNASQKKLEQCNLGSLSSLVHQKHSCFRFLKFWNHKPSETNRLPPPTSPCISLCITVPGQALPDHFLHRRQKHLLMVPSITQLCTCLRPL